MTAAEKKAYNHGVRFKNNKEHNVPEMSGHLKAFFDLGIQYGEQEVV